MDTFAFNTAYYQQQLRLRYGLSPTDMPEYTGSVDPNSYLAWLGKRYHLKRIDSGRWASVPVQRLYK